jgi:hypothetical protein
MTGARKWDQSVCDTSHAYELIGAQFQVLFMLLKDEIRHNQEELRLESSRSRRLTLAQGELMSLLDLLRVGLSLAQPLHERGLIQGPRCMSSRILR